MKRVMGIAMPSCWALALMLVACAGPPEAAAQRMGACRHTYRSGIVAITQAWSGAAGTPRLQQVLLSDLKVNGKSVPAEQVPALFNVTAEGAALVCNVPCSFGAEPGRWELLAAASGHVPAAVSVEARYAVFTPGCPSYNDQGTPLEVKLAPAVPG